jgi:hypothetical protein
MSWGKKDPSMTSAQTIEATPSRQCGDCNICCTAMKVPALDKPAGVRCVHQTPQGCGNYEHRPAPCREWYCLWVRDQHGLFNDSQRPDRLGIFFTASPPDAAGRQVIGAHETHPGAAHSFDAKQLILFLGQFAKVRVIPAPTPITPLTVKGQTAAA